MREPETRLFKPPSRLDEPGQEPGFLIPGDTAMSKNAQALDRRAKIDAALRADREARRARERTDMIANTVANFEQAQLYGPIKPPTTELYRLMTGAIA